MESHFQVPKDYVLNFGYKYSYAHNRLALPLTLFRYLLNKPTSILRRRLVLSTSHRLTPFPSVSSAFPVITCLCAFPPARALHITISSFRSTYSVFHGRRTLHRLLRRLFFPFMLGS